MKFSDIASRVNGIPHTTVEKGRLIYETILENRLKNTLELGFACGVGSCYIAGALDELGEGSLVSVDMPNARDRVPTGPELSRSIGLDAYIQFVFHELGYNWFLMDAVAENKSFDFCFLDGAHTWDVDALAFYLTDLVLIPGGVIIFDDLDWCYAKSPTWGKVDAPELLRQTAGVRKVVELW
ncbi:class I SAM-dependent methyltransferase [Rhizobium sp. G21]|uniref:class I SAM-dependent methyltransferase n=1 Tax=Rhizobium sp. G21 TaxID=2758439 RepID=UPI0015FFC8A5|nr:class I SAM-dependent methyltransferase [Rhizobium sp. G21]MBB1249812.1 class I SAM-dependent methyltransferase [Rhizobium sp. G21]